jgi:serine phosphatase RsbU (regulator of sigma subunit)/predicted enzyme related to lactoylglutathione lyase
MADETPGSYLRVQTITLPVADLDRSLEFYETRLGFKVVVRRMPSFGGGRIGIVSPSHGSVILILSELDPEHRLGTATGVSFLTDDLAARHAEWVERGVEFTEAPQSAPWGARHATFVDIDRNAFHLVEADVVTQQLESERRADVERAERERHAAHEIAIATQVQAGLFPRRRAPLSTLDYEGVCVQARQVGGDYFDFLDFGRGRVGLVIGDVSGKGLGAALLMANLQAHIRGQFARHADDLPGLLSSINHLFKQSAPAASYATLFFGLYDDHTRRLRFVNCGHPPPLLLRHDGTTERLETASWVLGMFDEWTGHASEIPLAEGDVLGLYTDGVTEAANAHGEEFGEARLAAALNRPAVSRAAELLDHVLSDVQLFTGAHHADDITMVVARCTG